MLWQGAAARNSLHCHTAAPTWENVCEQPWIPGQHLGLAEMEEKPVPLFPPSNRTQILMEPCEQLCLVPASKRSETKLERTNTKVGASIRTPRKTLGFLSLKPGRGYLGFVRLSYHLMGMANALRDECRHMPRRGQGLPRAMLESHCTGNGPCWSHASLQSPARPQAAAWAAASVRLCFHSLIPGTGLSPP